MATYTFGTQPEDVLTNSHGDVLPGVRVEFYPTKADAQAGTSLLDTVLTDAKGRPKYTSTEYPMVYGKTPDGEVWALESEEYAIDPANSETAAEAAQAAAEAAQAAAEAAQTAAENTTGQKGDKGDKGDTGPRGIAGAAGPPGESAYEVAVDNGFAGTQAEWLLSLKGPKGDPGDGTGGGGGVPETRIIQAGPGLTGGGDLSEDRTLSVNFGDQANTVAEGDDYRLSDARNPLPHSHQVSDVSGLGAALAQKADLDSPAFTGTVTGITPSMVGLANVDNTSDMDKPISTAVQAALNNVSLAGIEGLPAGVAVVQFYTAADQARPDNDDISVLWVGPADVIPANAVAGKDLILAAASA